MTKKKSLKVGDKVKIVSTLNSFGVNYPIRSGNKTIDLEKSIFEIRDKRNKFFLLTEDGSGIGRFHIHNEDLEKVDKRRKAITKYL